MHSQLLQDGSCLADMHVWLCVSTCDAWLEAVAAVMQDRDHLKFVCKLKDYVSDREHLLDSIPGALAQAGLTVEAAELSDAEKFLKEDYFKNTKLLELMSGQQTTCDVHPASGGIAPGVTRTINPNGSQH